MARLIDIDAVVAEIKGYKDSFCDRNGYLEDSETNGLAYDTLCELEDSIETLEVKEVDLEKELKNLIEKEKAFVTDKACRAIEKLLSGYIIRNFNFGDSYDIDRLIEDFKKAMEE